MMQRRTSRNDSASANVGRKYAYLKARKAWLTTAGTTCWLCSRPVRFDVHYLHVDAPTVDHAIECDLYAVDPLDTRYWLLAHRACNSRRGALYQQRKAKQSPQPGPVQTSRPL